jgi:hypothetical protein
LSHDGEKRRLPSDGARIKEARRATRENPKREVGRYKGLCWFKSSEAVDFASRFVTIIESTNFKLESIKSTNLDTKSTILEIFKLIF